MNKEILRKYLEIKSIKDLRESKYPGKEFITEKINDDKSVLEKLNEFIGSFEFSNEYKNDKFQSKGIYGYMSYDSINYFENIKLSNKNYGDSIPQMLYCLYENVIVVNTFNNQSTIIYRINRKIEKS